MVKEKYLTVNSLSGGKTSSYLAVHYPADINIFAIVTSGCHNCNTKLSKDKKLLQKINDRIERNSVNKSPVVSSTEDILTLKAIFQLEQKIGKEIIWVRSLTWEEMMDKRKAIPNQAMRFCTYELKILPIFEYLQSKSHNMVDMRIGFRYGEENRASRLTTEIKYVDSCNLFGQRRKKWKTVTWRKGSFPLIDDKIIYPTIIDYWNKNQDVQFPLDSNCQMCPHKNSQQIRKNYEENKSIILWGAVQEEIRQNRFLKKTKLINIPDLPIQKEFVFGGGAGCGSGMCIS